MAEGYQFENIDLSCLTSSTFSVVSFTFNILVSTVTIFGNSLVILSIYKYPRQFKGSLYMFIGNLAAADLLLGVWLFVLMFEEIFPDVKQNWYYCISKPIGIFITYGCSTLSLLGISFDRFMAVMFPLKHLIRTTKRNTFSVLLTCIWVISIITGISPVFLHTKPLNNTFICRIGTIAQREFDFIPSVVITLTVIIELFLYGIVIWKIKTKKTPGSSASTKKNTKTVLMIIVFVLFVVCLMPFVICSLMMQADISTATLQNIMCIREYVAKLGLLNAALNWILYGLANQKFRTAFKAILCCKCYTYLSRRLFSSSKENRIRRSSTHFEHSVDGSMALHKVQSNDIKF